MDENEEEPPTENAGFRFGIRTLLWVTAILSVAMALLGPGWGLFLATVVFIDHVYWWARRNNRSLIAACQLSLLLITAASFIIAASVPFLMPPRVNSRPSPRLHSLMNLKCLVMGTHEYYSTHGHYPPSFSTDDDGQPLHSWRTLLLPYIEQGPLYDRIQLDEAWDSPANKQVFEGVQMPVLQSPREPARKAAIDETQYLAIVDEQTVWSPSQPVQIADISDDGANTIVLIEVAGREIPWYEPRDLTLNEAIDLLIGEADDGFEWIRAGFFVSERMRNDRLDSRWVAYADGHSEVLYTLADRETARAFLTRSGGEDHAKLLNRTNHREPRVIGYIFHWGRIWGTAVFVVLAIGPFFTQRKNT